MGMRDRPIQGFAAVAGGLSAAFGCNLRKFQIIAVRGDGPVLLIGLP